MGTIWTAEVDNRLCPLCSADSTQEVSRKMQFGLDLVTVVCQCCSLVYTNPVPSEEVYNRFYTDVYSDYYGKIAQSAPRLSGSSEPVGIAQLLDKIETFLPVQGKRLLEVGPGRGNFLYWAKKRGASVCGIEPSREFHEFLLENQLESVNTTLENTAELGLGKFDMVAMFHVLEHFYDPNRALQECREILNEDGLIIIIVPNILKPYRSLDRYFLRYVHMTNFSPDTLVAMLGKHGFELEHLGDDGSPAWHDPHNIMAIFRKRSVVPVPTTVKPPTSAEILQQLDQYRRKWRWVNGPRWYLWYTVGRKQILGRGVRFLKRSLPLLKRS